jgi:hypothetical protein
MLDVPVGHAGLDRKIGAGHRHGGLRQPPAAHQIKLKPFVGLGAVVRAHHRPAEGIAGRGQRDGAGLGLHQFSRVCLARHRHEQVKRPADPDGAGGAPSAFPFHVRPDEAGDHDEHRYQGEAHHQVGREFTEDEGREERDAERGQIIAEDVRRDREGVLRRALAERAFVPAGENPGVEKRLKGDTENGMGDAAVLDDPRP